MNKLAMCLAMVATMSVSGVAFADEPVGSAPQVVPARRGEITLPDQVITGRWMRPQVSVTVSRIDTQLTLVELKQIFLQRIEDGILKGAF
jgi:hypothetical protein